MAIRIEPCPAVDDAYNASPGGRTASHLAAAAARCQRTAEFSREIPGE